VNFSGVEQEIRKHTERAALLPDGDYVVKILNADMRENEDTGSRGVNVRVQVVKPKKYTGKVQYGYCSLKKEALWNFRNLINAALGKNVAGRTVDVNLGRFEGKTVGAVIEQDEYNNKVRSRVSTWFPEDEYEGTESDDEDEDEEDYEDEEDEDAEEDEEEDEEEEPEPPRRRKKPASRSRRSRKDEEDEEELDEVDVDEL
jgi:hypothetical protein